MVFYYKLPNGELDMFQWSKNNIKYNLKGYLFIYLFYQDLKGYSKIL